MSGIQHWYASDIGGMFPTNTPPVRPDNDWVKFADHKAALRDERHGWATVCDNMEAEIDRLRLLVNEPQNDTRVKTLKDCIEAIEYQINMHADSDPTQYGLKQSLAVLNAMLSIANESADA